MFGKSKDFTQWVIMYVAMVALVVVASIIFRPTVLAFLATLVVCSLSFVLAVFVDTSAKRNKDKPRPIVRVWTHNGDTVITTDKIYRLSLELREELLKALGSVNPGMIRIRPLVYAYRGPDRLDSGLTLEQLNVVLDSCCVQKTEMDIPMARSGFCPSHSINFKQLWKLIHGSDAKPPEFPREVPEKPSVA